MGGLFHKTVIVFLCLFFSVNNICCLASEPELQIQKAALLIGAPDGSGSFKVFEGQVTWEEASDAAGMPEVLANISIQSAKLNATIILSKSDRFELDPIIEVNIKFDVLNGNIGGSLSNIKMIQMRNYGESHGVNLSGLDYPVDKDSFSVELNVGKDNKTDIELMLSRGWFDIPVLLSSGLTSKLTFEKGSVGKGLIEKAFKAWHLSGIGAN